MSDLIKLTKTERAILVELWSSASKSLPYHQMGAGLTPRGRRMVHNRMEDRRLIARSGLDSGDWTITFRGMQALGVTNAEWGLSGASDGTSLPGSTPVHSATAAKDAALLRKLDRKIGAGKATRADVMRAIDLKRSLSLSKGMEA